VLLLRLLVALKAIKQAWFPARDGTLARMVVCLGAQASRLDGWERTMQARRLRSQGRAFAACAGFLLAAAGWLLPGEAAAPPLEQAVLQMPPSVAQGQSVILRLAAGPSAAP